uniref:Protein kinase domain-containing protein n=2 Tax=Vitis vinifera TaxID=29760 RepID=F6H7E5_VITVI
MLREEKLVAVGLIALLHVCFISICAADENQTCRPSSCGDIRNISNPFRLKGDPSGCGDPNYELVCENNRTMLNLYSGKYYVAEINYKNYSIRIVDPGLDKGDCFSSPLYYLTRGNFSYGDPYDLPYDWKLSRTVLMNCTSSISDHSYIRINPCNSSSTSFSSQAYVYALAGVSEVGDIKYSCTIGMTISTRPLKEVSSKPRNQSMSELQEELLVGLEISFLPYRCSSECHMEGQSCYMNFIENTITCVSNRGCGDWSSCLKPTWLRKFLFDFLFPLIDAIFSVEPSQIFSVRDLLNDLPFSLLGWIIRVILIIVAGRAVIGMLCLCAFLIYKFQRRHLSMDDTLEEFLQSHNNLQPIRYSYSEIKKMTNNFQDKLGQGGFGSVYKGKLRSGQIVAVKMLVVSKSNGQDFINEVATIGRIHHVNVVRLVGFCTEKSKYALVYDFMANGSLDKYVFLERENSIPLSWERLYNIALGVAHGIEYLHRGCEMQILHFDIKPHNILLDENFTPKVSDFGLAKLYSSDQNAVTLTAARGTLGYIAPELFYKNIGDVSYKADVYSFGMLLMEMMGKRKYMNARAEKSEIFFPSWIYDRIDRGEDMEMGEATEEEKKYIRKIIIVALWCVQMKPTNRPSMSKALEMLESEVELLQMPSKPTLHSKDLSMEDGMNNPIGAPVSSCNGTMTISLEGR